jgi:hypothetical protein
VQFLGSIQRVLARISSILCVAPFLLSSSGFPVLALQAPVLTHRVCSSERRLADSIFLSSLCRGSREHCSVPLCLSALLFVGTGARSGEQPLRAVLSIWCCIEVSAPTDGLSQQQQRYQRRARKGRACLPKRRSLLGTAAPSATVCLFLCFLFVACVRRLSSRVERSQDLTQVTIRSLRDRLVLLSSTLA